jgi:type IV pilus assembly protein PilM
MPSLSDINIKLPSPNLKLGFGRRSGSNVVGLDIQPGFVGAVQASVNGSILVKRAACLPLASDTVREGEVVDEGVLSNVLRELFGGVRLSKRVRVGVANQRTVMRTLELPPITDRKELATAVHFQAQDQVPMPLSNAVLDFHPLGIVETPGGPRQHVVLVAAQLDMVEHLLAAVRGAGLQPVGIDLSAFALIRSLYRPEPEPEAEQAGRVVYLNVDGLTNLAIAEGLVCRFTRMVGGGLEGMAGELAVRRGIPLTDARAMLANVDLSMHVAVDQGTVAPRDLTVPVAAPDLRIPEEATLKDAVTEEVISEEVVDESETVHHVETTHFPHDDDALEQAASYAETSSPEQASTPEIQPARADGDADARNVLENGIREISGEVRNSLDFHRSQEGGGEVSHVVLSGSALDLPGFAEALQGHLGLEVRTETVPLVDDSSAGGISMNRLAVAAGLAAEEVHQ